MIFYHTFSRRIVRNRVLLFSKHNAIIEAASPQKNYGLQVSSMTQDERNQRTRARIMSAARKEFGDNSYEAASINTICAAEGLSKGLLYHHFKDKDELYLTCVRECFEDLLSYMEQQMPPSFSENIDQDLALYFQIRLAFFQRNPDEQKIFFRAMLTPPKHLSEALARLRKPVEEFNRRILASILKNTKLRSGITIEEVCDLELMLQNYANNKPGMYHTALGDIISHENMCLRWIGLLLYGVVQTSSQ